MSKGVSIWIQPFDSRALALTGRRRKDMWRGGWKHHTKGRGEDIDWGSGGLLSLWALKGF